MISYRLLATVEIKLQTMQNWARIKTSKNKYECERTHVYVILLIFTTCGQT